MLTTVGRFPPSRNLCPAVPSPVLRPAWGAHGGPMGGHGGPRPAVWRRSPMATGARGGRVTARLLGVPRPASHCGEPKADRPRARKIRGGRAARDSATLRRARRLRNNVPPRFEPRGPALPRTSRAAVRSGGSGHGRRCARPGHLRPACGPPPPMAPPPGRRSASRPPAAAAPAGGPMAAGGPSAAAHTRGGSVYKPRALRPPAPRSETPAGRPPGHARWPE